MKKCPNCSKSITVKEFLRIYFAIGLTCSKCSYKLEFKNIPYLIINVITVAIMGVILTNYVPLHFWYYLVVILTTFVVNILLVLQLPLVATKK